MREYVDVRGVWPIYVCGFVAIEMRNCYRTLTVEQARAILASPDNLIF